jgi:hypothetical protein
MKDNEQDLLAGAQFIAPAPGTRARHSAIRHPPFAIRH